MHTKRTIEQESHAVVNSSRITIYNIEVEKYFSWRTRQTHAGRKIYYSLIRRRGQQKKVFRFFIFLGKPSRSDQQLATRSKKLDIYYILWRASKVTVAAAAAVVYVSS